MEFRTQQLVITVLPEKAELAKACLWHTRICIHPTICRFATCPGLTCFAHTCFGGTCYAHSCFDFSCHQFSCAANTCLCSVLPSQCGPVSPCGALSACGGLSGCGVTYDPWVIRQVDDIKVLREELQGTLKQLEQVEKTGLGTEIASADVASELEAKLEAALKEVREQKAKLAKKRG